MSIIRPFAGIRYNLAKVGELGRVVAPPYDVIKPERQRQLHERSAFNVIRLILGEDQPSHGTRDNKYVRAAALWRQWLADGTLRRDPAPRLYRYQVSFEVKTAEGIVTRSRPGFVALLKLHEYRDGKVLPHERTLAGPKEDRFQLMLHTRAHLSQVFILYPDGKGVVDDALGYSPPPGAETISCEDDDGVIHTLWPVDDRQAIAAVTAHLDERKLYIADGHHRYETALNLRRHLRQTSPLFAEGCDYIMAYFTPVEDPGLVIFPYHRVLHGLPKRRFTGLVKKLEEHFRVDRALVSPFEPGTPRREFIRELESRGRQQPTFGMIDGLSGDAFFLALRPDAHLPKSPNPIDLFLSRLDVVILEDLILTSCLGIQRKDLLNEKFVAYETDYDRTLALALEPPHQLAFLMNPTPVHDVIRVADLQGIMPEKSTYFFPKIASGMVMNDMEA
jgi:uncharacterized protein (DUF1015 family)